MKPCRNRRKEIALLAIEELNEEQARARRAHLEVCYRCRAYLEEMNAVTERIRAAKVEPELEASESFHRRLVGALRAQEARGGSFGTFLRQCSLSWRVRLAAGLTVLALVGVWASLALHPRGAVSATGRSSTAATQTHLDSGLAPTVANYSAVANRSLDQLDELLTQQAKSRSAPLPVFTAATRM